MIDLDDEASLAAADPGRMLGSVASLAEHCRHGYELGRSAEGIASADGVTSVTFCGMGGSAVAGEVLRALYRERLGVPVDVNRSSVLPEYCGPHTLVVASSYSGGTDETLACFREALARGCRIVPIASGGALAAEAREADLGVVEVPGGFVPRAAFGYLSLATLGALENAGLLPPAENDVREAIGGLSALAPRLGPSAHREENPAKELAWQIGDRVPVIWGAEGIGSVAAARWKAQFNENAKIPAWASSLPELDHNEVVGWAPGEGTHSFVVALRHGGEPADVVKRFGPSIRIAAESGAVVEEVWGAGRSALARLLSLVQMGDFVSTYHALAHGIDPSPMDAIDRLKAALAEAG